MFKLPWKIVKRKEYEDLKWIASRPINPTIKVVSQHEFKKYCKTGVWTARDPLPFDDALELMIRNARDELKDQIDIAVDIETWDDGVTKTVRLTAVLCEARDV